MNFFGAGYEFAHKIIEFVEGFSISPQRIIYKICESVFDGCSKKPTFYIDRLGKDSK